MKFLKIVMTLLFTVGCLFSQVSNVRVQQRTDGNFITDIWYDVSYSGDDMLTVFVEASADNGATWDLVCESLTGDVGGNIIPGTDKHVVWDFYADNPNISGTQYKVRVIARDDYMVGNDGKLYKTVVIGNQTWLAENLRETKYRNGDPIPEETNPDDWPFFTTGVRCSPNDSEPVGQIYGYLYNWHVVSDTRQIAPEGWHVPSHDEWKAFRTFLWKDDLDHYAGAKIKEAGTVHWNPPNAHATNSSGFTAIPAGRRYADDSAATGFFSDYGWTAYWWTSTNYYSEKAYFWLVSTYNPYLNYYNKYLMTTGMSIRLIKD